MLSLEYTPFQYMVVYISVLQVGFPPRATAPITDLELIRAVSGLANG